MKKVIIIVAVLVILGLMSLDMFAQEKRTHHAGHHGHHARHDMKAVLDSAIAVAQQHAMNTQPIQWDIIKSEMHKAAAGATSVKDLKPSLEILLNALNDANAKFIDPTTKNDIAVTTQVTESQPDGADKNTLSFQRTDVAFEYGSLENGIGYLRITGNLEGNVQNHAAIIREAVDSLSKHESGKWIIDLRYLNAGDFHSIVAGVAPILGEGLVASTVNNKNRVDKLFEVHNGNFYVEQIRVGKFSSAKPLASAKVAVLIGSNTSGVGEIAAITFKQRKNTRFFGEETAGQITCVREIGLHPELTMSLSEGFYQDRMGNTYKRNVAPDVVVKKDASMNKVDACVTQAMTWLATNQQYASLNSEQP